MESSDSSLHQIEFYSIRPRRICALDY